MKKRDISGCSPYDRHVADDMMCTRDGSLTQTVVATGLASQVSDAEVSNGLYSRWMRMLEGISLKPHMALWIHLERRLGSGELGATKESEYDLHDADERPLENHLSVSPVCRVTDGRSQRTWDRDLRVLSHIEPVQMSGEADLRALSAQVRSCLHRHQPAGLGLTAHDDRRSSELLAFYARLISAEVRTSCSDAGPQEWNLDTSALHFGSDIVAIDTPHGRRYAAALTMIGPCPAERIRSDVFESMLSAPFEFVLNQSITATMIDRSKSLHSLERLKPVDHRVQADRADTPDASGSPLPMFEHELVLIIYGDSVAQLEVNVRRATALLDAKGMYLSCEQGSALVCAYFSVLPGNFRMGRLRAMPLNAEGLAKLFPLMQHRGSDSRDQVEANADAALS